MMDCNLPVDSYFQTVSLNIVKLAKENSSSCNQNQNICISETEFKILVVVLIEVYLTSINLQNSYHDHIQIKSLILTEEFLINVKLFLILIKGCIICV